MLSLKEWSKVGLGMGQFNSTLLSIEEEVSDYLLQLYEFIVSAMSLRESREFNDFVEFS